MVDSTEIEWKQLPQDSAELLAAKDILGSDPHRVRMVRIVEIEPYPISLQNEKFWRGDYDLSVPVILYYGGPQNRLRVFDGAHRIEAATRSGRSSVRAVVLTKEDIDEIAPLG
jgi:hypothetical protein